MRAFFWRVFLLSFFLQDSFKVHSRSACSLARGRPRSAGREGRRLLDRSSSSPFRRRPGASGKEENEVFLSLCWTIDLTWQKTSTLEMLDVYVSICLCMRSSSVRLKKRKSRVSVRTVERRKVDLNRKRKLPQCVPFFLFLHLGDATARASIDR